MHLRPIRRSLWPAGMVLMHTATITKRLNAAEPTIVEAPSLPCTKVLFTMSFSDSMISGADEPSAIKVSVATVSFQTSLYTGHS